MSLHGVGMRMAMRSSQRCGGTGEDAMGLWMRFGRRQRSLLRLVPLVWPLECRFRALGDVLVGSQSHAQVPCLSCNFTWNPLSPFLRENRTSTECVGKCRDTHVAPGGVARFRLEMGGR